MINNLKKYLKRRFVQQFTRFFIACLINTGGNLVISMCNTISYLYQFILFGTKLICVKRFAYIYERLSRFSKKLSKFSCFSTQTKTRHQSHAANDVIDYLYVLKKRQNFGFGF